MGQQTLQTIITLSGKVDNTFGNIGIKKRTVLFQLTHSIVQLRLDIAAFFIYCKIYARFTYRGNG